MVFAYDLGIYLHMYIYIHLANVYYVCINYVYYIYVQFYNTQYVTHLFLFMGLVYLLAQTRYTIDGYKYIVCVASWAKELLA